MANQMTNLSHTMRFTGTMLYCMPTISVMFVCTCPQKICASKLLAFPFGQIDSEPDRKETHTKVKTYLCNHLYQDKSLRKVKKNSITDISRQIFITPKVTVKNYFLFCYTINIPVNIPYNVLQGVMLILHLRN